MNKRMLALTLGVLLAMTTASAAFAALPMSALDLEGDGDEIEYKYGSIEVSDEVVTLTFDEGDELNHGHVVSSAVALLKSDLEDLSDYRLGCLVRQVAKSDLGKKSYDGDWMAELNLEGCEKKKADTDGDDEDRGGPPPWAGPKDQRDPDALPPGQAKKAGD